MDSSILPQNWCNSKIQLEYEIKVPKELMFMHKGIDEWQKYVPADNANKET